MGTFVPRPACVNTLARLALMERSDMAQEEGINVRAAALTAVISIFAVVAAVFASAALYQRVNARLLEGREGDKAPAVYNDQPP
jgi:hypothetical protein